MINIIVSMVCAAISYPKKMKEGLPWVSGHTPTESGSWYHHQVNDWVENFRGHKVSINTRVWSCFMAFLSVVEFIIIIFLFCLLIYLVRK